MRKSNVRSAQLCYEAADADLAQTLVRDLNLNCPHLTIQTDAIEHSSGFLSAVENALSAEYPIVLLSPNSVPQHWTRSEWEPLLVGETRRLGVQVVYVLLSECNFPKVLRRGSFFDLSRNCLNGQRDLKRWLLADNPLFDIFTALPCSGMEAKREHGAIDGLYQALVDRPGMEKRVEREIALAFAHQTMSDFAGVFWIDCAHRSRTGIVGDAAHALGLQLRGPVDRNTEVLKDLCAGNRLLFVFNGATPEDVAWMTPEGKSSWIFVQQDDVTPFVPVGSLKALFTDWRRNANECLRALGPAQAYLSKLSEYDGEEWSLAVSLGRGAFSLTRDAGRLAEALEFLETVIFAMRAKGDLVKVAELNREKVWILEEWDVTISDDLRQSSIGPCSQLSLF